LRIVLSHNRLTELTGIATLRNLVKLSVAHNDLHNLPSLAHCPQLKELRLNDNKLIALPSDLRQNNAIEVLDVGNNLVRELSDVSVVGQLPNLINLNFKGNVVATKDNYAPNVKDMVKSLRILDGERFDQKYVQRKLKRDALSRKRSPESAPTSVSETQNALVIIITSKRTTTARLKRTGQQDSLRNSHQRNCRKRRILSSHQRKSKRTSTPTRSSCPRRSPNQPSSSSRRSHPNQSSSSRRSQPKPQRRRQSMFPSKQLPINGPPSQSSGPQRGSNQTSGPASSRSSRRPQQPAQRQHQWRQVPRPSGRSCPKQPRATPWASVLDQDGIDKLKKFVQMPAFWSLSNVHRDNRRG